LEAPPISLYLRRNEPSKLGEAVARYFRGIPKYCHLNWDAGVVLVIASALLYICTVAFTLVLVVGEVNLRVPLAPVAPASITILEALSPAGNVPFTVSDFPAGIIRAL